MLLEGAQQFFYTCRLCLSQGSDGWDRKVRLWLGCRADLTVTAGPKGLQGVMVLGGKTFLADLEANSMLLASCEGVFCDTQGVGSICDVKTGFVKISVTQCPQCWLLCWQRRLSGPSFMHTLKEAASLSLCITIISAYQFLASGSGELGLVSEVEIHYREESLACLIPIHPDLKVICI